MWGAAKKSLRALGVGTERHIRGHYIRGRYPGLAKVLTDLETEGQIQRVELREQGRACRGVRYVHRVDPPLLEQLSDSGESSKDSQTSELFSQAALAWQPRTTLLSPFDNLICDRARTEALFGFCYRMEIYVP